MLRLFGLQVPEFGNIGPHKLRAEVVKRLLAELVGVYEEVYSVLLKPGAGYSDVEVRAKVKYTPA